MYDFKINRHNGYIQHACVRALAARADGACYLCTHARNKFRTAHKENSPRSQRHDDHFEKRDTRDSSFTTFVKFTAGSKGSNRSVQIVRRAY